MTSNRLQNLIVLASGLTATLAGIVYVACSKPHPYWTRELNSPFKFTAFSPKILPSLPGLENLVRMMPQVYSGGEPQGDEGFAALQRHTVKTIISVDGARPDVDTAHKYEMRYVHIPLGYDGIPEEAALKLVAVLQTTTGPWYVHCHHGQHRGPAAAVILCRATGLIGRDAARQLLEMAGTSHEYEGLWRDALDFEPPPPDTPLPDLEEIAPVDRLVTAMVQIDRNFAAMNKALAGEKSTAESQSTAIPRHEALMVQEGFVEALRAIGPDQDEELRTWLKDAEKLATQISADLAANRPAEAHDRITQLQDACHTCHMKHRN